MPIITGHFARTESNATWTTGNYSPTLNDWLSLDAKCMQSINAVMGGTWAPLTPINIQGAGLTLGAGLIIQGPSGYLRSNTAGAFKITLGTWPQLGTAHAGRTRTIVTNCVTGRSNVQGNPYVTPPTPIIPSQLVPNLAAGGAQTQLGTGIPIGFTVPLRVANGATLSLATVRFKVGYPHSSAPTPPKLRIVRVDPNGVAVPLTSQAAGGDANGYISPTINSGSAWYDGGVVQTLTITCDQNNLVDTSQYNYELDVVEESGMTGFPWSAQLQNAVTATTTGQNIALRGTGSSPSLDGVTLLTGTVILVKDQADPTYNGIWTVNTTSNAPYTQIAISPGGGLVVPVSTNGAQNGGTVWAEQPTSGNQLPPLWAASTAYRAGQLVAPSTANGMIFQCTTAGTSFTSEPLWPTTPGATVGDNTVTWTAVTNNCAQNLFSQIQNSSSVVGSGYALFGNIWGNVDVLFTNITQARVDE